MKGKSLSRVRLLAAPWTAAYQALRPWDFPGKSTGVGAIAFSDWKSPFPIMVATNITSQGLSRPLGTSNRVFTKAEHSKTKKKKKNDVPFSLGTNAAESPEGTAPSAGGGGSGGATSPVFSLLF